SRQYPSSFGFFFLCIFSYLPSSEFGVLDVQDHRVGVTVPQAAVRLQPRKELGVFYQALLFCQCLEIFRIFASLGLDVVDVCLVCHRFALAPVRVAEAWSTRISSLARPFQIRRGSTSLTLAASRGATPCVASPHLAPSVLGGPLNPGFPGRDYDAFRTEALCDPLRAFRPALGEVVDPLDDPEVLETGLPNRPQIVGLDRGPPDAIGPQLSVETAHGPDVFLEHDVRTLE